VGGGGGGGGAKPQPKAAKKKMEQFAYNTRTEKSWYRVGSEDVRWKWRTRKQLETLCLEKT